jgi:hypothetical protein
MIFSMNKEQKMGGFNKMVQQPTHFVVRSEFSEKFFLGMLSPCVVTTGGLRVRRTSPRAVFFSGATSKPRYTNTVNTLGGLEKAITQEVAAIPPEMTRRVTEKHRERLNQCIDNELE